MTSQELPRNPVADQRSESYSDSGSSPPAASQATLSAWASTVNVVMCRDVGITVNVLAWVQMPICASPTV